MSKKKQQRGKKKDYDWGDSDDEQVVVAPAVQAKKKAVKKTNGPVNAFALLNAMSTDSSDGDSDTDSSSSEVSSDEEAYIPQPVKKRAKPKSKPVFNAFAALDQSDSDSGSESDLEEERKVKGKKSKIKDLAQSSDEEELEEKKKKKSKKSKSKDLAQSSDEEELEDKKKKKSKKSKSKNLAQSSDEEELEDKKKKKSKKSKSKDLAQSSDEEELEEKKKKKSKKHKSKDLAQSSDEEELEEKKKKKSKKHKSKVLAQSSDEEELDDKKKKKSKKFKSKDLAQSSDEEELEDKKKKKSKKHKSKDLAQSSDEEELEDKKKKKSKKCKSSKRLSSSSDDEDALTNDAEERQVTKEDKVGAKHESARDVLESDSKLAESVENLSLSANSSAATTPVLAKKRQGKFRPDKAAARAAAAAAASVGGVDAKSDGAVDLAQENVPTRNLVDSKEPETKQTKSNRTFVDDGSSKVSAVTSVSDALSKVSFNKGGSAIPTEVLDLRFRRPAYADTSGLAVTGTLTSDKNSRDVQVDKFSLQAYGQPLVRDSALNLLYGRKYGLIGANGCGKSSLLQALGWGEVPLPRLVDVFLLDREYDATELSALEAVMDIVTQEKAQLEDEMEALLDLPNGQNEPKFEYVMERISELDASGSEVRAKDILHGLGFDDEMCAMQTREFSGGWRMRIALARALFVKPTLLLLDDPSNHLDLGAVVWLEEYLEAYDSTILMVSHSQDFLNGVCTDIIHLSHGSLEYYSGNYDTFSRSRHERDQNLAKRARQEERALAKMKEAAGRSGETGKKLAKSKEKALQKKLDKSGGSAIEQVDQARTKELVIRFNECGGGLAPPVIAFRDVAFGYPGRSELFSDLNIGIDLDSRVALVGPNGAGKSTLMKLLDGSLEPTNGHVTFRNGLRIARFHQHLTEQLNLKQSAVGWMMDQFPEENYKEHFLRLVLGRFGLTGKHQVVAMRQLSDGQRRRVLFSWLSMRTPHLLFLDEPSNHLDLETIDALADGLNNFDGGVVLVSHDFRLIDQVCDEIWIVEEGKCERYEGSIQEYKEVLRQRVISSGLGR